MYRCGVPFAILIGTKIKGKSFPPRNHHLNSDVDFSRAGFGIFKRVLIFAVAIKKIAYAKGFGEQKGI